jgi:histone deacetylase 6
MQGSLLFLRPLQVSPACFAHLLHLVSALARGKVVALLEGGYFLPSLAEAATLTLKTMLGDPCPAMPKMPGKRPCKEMAEAIRNVKAILRPYWKCFQVSSCSCS